MPRRRGPSHLYARNAQNTSKHGPKFLIGKNLNVECRGPADGDLALPVDGSRHNGERLGPVGSTIVAEVFVGLVHGDTASYLCTKKN